VKPRGGEGQNGRLKCPTGFLVFHNLPSEPLMSLMRRLRMRDNDAAPVMRSYELQMRDACRDEAGWDRCVDEGELDTEDQCEQYYC